MWIVPVAVEPNARRRGAIGRRAQNSGNAGAIGDNVPFPPPFVAADPATIERMRSDDAIFAALGDDIARQTPAAASIVWTSLVSDYAGFEGRWEVWANDTETSDWARGSWETLMQFEADFAVIRQRFVEQGGRPSRAAIVPPSKLNLPGLGTGLGTGLVVGLVAVVALVGVAAYYAPKRTRTRG